MKRLLAISVLFFASGLFAQTDKADSLVSSNKKQYSQTDTVPVQAVILPRPRFFQQSWYYNKKRAALVIGSESALATGSLIALSQAWYKDYPRESFHTFNDNGEWLQMDKAGHVVTAYTVGGYGMNLLKWAGVKRKKAILFGGLTGFAYQGVIEIFDGYSSGWGFSTGDFAANTIGAGLLIGQEFLWQEQRIVPKYSFSKTGYAQYRPSLLGANFTEQLLKDYNGQTYWLSANIASFIPGENKFPKWLNIAFGYGANGMTGGHANPPYYNSSGTLITFERYRQFYIAPDIDLTKIPVRSHFLKALFGTFGFVKFPLPGIEISRSKITGKLIAY